ncbi:MAG: outer membrane protein transport protein, partial [Halothiobacillaceae bacterium]|nr:outer membrane protein transport protein [Halothiobacillaceae bacterium]
MESSKVRIFNVYLRKPLAFMVSACGFVDASLASHGMNMDAYGARAGGMGGASYAYDSGNSAMMNNPASLCMCKHPGNDFELGLSTLSPHISAEHPHAGSVSSSGTHYNMPSMSFVHAGERYTYGIGVYSQGGMGTEYGAGSSLFAGGMSMMGKRAMLSGEDIRSEMSVGRVMFPLAYKVNDQLSLAAQIDFVWAGLDLKMDMDGRSFGSMVQSGRASGSMVNAFQGAMQQGRVSDVNYARFDFSNSSDFTGKANNVGYAGKLGLVFRVTDALSIGASYH